LIEDATHLRLIVSGLFAAWFEIHSAEGLHFLFVDQVRLFNLVLETVKVLRIGQRLGGPCLVAIWGSGAS
jgi:hypothetical protein